MDATRRALFITQIDISHCVRNGLFLSPDGEGIGESEANRNFQVQ